MTSVNRARRRSAGIALALVFGSVLGAAGCAAEPGDGATKPSRDGEPTTSAPTTTPPPTSTAPAKLPGCGDLLPLQEVRRISDDDRMVLLPDSTPFRKLVVENEFRAAAAAAYGSAAESEACSWGVPDTGLVTTLLVARLSDTQRAEVITELEGSGFERSDQNGDPVFTRYEEKGISGWLRAYLFHGNIWLTEVSSEKTPQFAINAAAGLPG